MQLKHWSTHLSGTRSPVLVWTAPCTLLRQSRLPKCFGRRQSHQQGALRSRRHICVTAYAGWLTVHVRQHPREVCPLAGGVMSQPLSTPLQSGLRVLPHLLPAALSRNLTTPLAARKAAGQRAYHVSQREHAGGVGHVSSPVVQQLRRGSSEPTGPDHVPFWSRPVSIVGLFSMTAFSDVSPGLTLPPHPRPRSQDARDRHGPARFRDLE
jgi:hypothetical protein